MTSFAFILGVVPLMLSEGAGAEMRRTLGTTVFVGMLGVTAFGIFLTPVFFSVIQWLKDQRPPKERDADDEAATNGHGEATRHSTSEGVMMRPYRQVSTSLAFTARPTRIMATWPRNPQARFPFRQSAPTVGRTSPCA